MASRWVARRFALSESLKISTELKWQYAWLHRIINCMFCCEVRNLFPNNFQVTYDMTQNIYFTHEYGLYFLVSDLLQ